jgi:hypothetical protein
MCFFGRNIEATRMHLRMGFYSWAFEGCSWGPVKVAGRYRKAEEQMSHWIAKYMSHVEDGMHETIDLRGWEAWTGFPRSCLNIQDMEVDAAPGAVETNALVVSDGEDEDEEAGDDGESGEGGDDDD